ncbi:hypothetical protein LTR37_003164 [Vermiconidia calcicola]|uniref:Uncharacterized protein n=1 Tax=Vermiconidia calcicola TaxID=1690605 RepID=A0ACC3NQT4_9PEZI|nr:hypothetical protein LTR37_003164 [Vermiconidia calcicola]
MARRYRNSLDGIHNRSYENSLDAEEKAGVDTIDRLEDHSPEPKKKMHKDLPGLSQEDQEWLFDIDEKEQSRIFHKVDMRLVPMLASLYLIAQLDRANIGNAKIEGLEASLGMEGNDYNIALMLFFVPYVLCEVPSNVLLSKFSRPSVYIGILVVCWGTIMTCMGTTQSFAGLCVTRFLLGIFEAGFFPGAIWLTSQWYPPNKTQGRMAMFYLSSAASGAFSGLLAAGLAQMDGLGGYEASWLTPDEAKFLELSHIALRGVKTNAKGSTEKKRFNWKVAKAVVTDWQLYLQTLVYWSNVVPNYGLKFTMPTIMQNMGFESTTAQLLSAPPYVCGAVAAVSSALVADKLRWRAPFILGFQFCLVVAFTVLFVFAPRIQDNVALCYVMVCLACIGLYPIIPGNATWTVNNLAGPEKRAMGIAFFTMMGNSGGFAGSFIFLERESPRYPTGFGSALGFACSGICACLLLEFLYFAHNKRYKGMTEEEAIEKHGEQKLADMGDKSPLFVYGY